MCNKDIESSRRGDSPLTIKEKVLKDWKDIPKENYKLYFDKAIEDTIRECREKALDILKLHHKEVCALDWKMCECNSIHKSLGDELK